MMLAGMMTCSRRSVQVRLPCGRRLFPLQASALHVHADTRRTYISRFPGNGKSFPASGKNFSRAGRAAGIFPGERRRVPQRACRSFQTARFLRRRVFSGRAFSSEADAPGSSSESRARPASGERRALRYFLPSTFSARSSQRERASSARAFTSSSTYMATAASAAARMPRSSVKPMTGMRSGITSAGRMR